MVLHVRRITLIMKWRMHGSKRSRSKLANHLTHYHRAISDPNNDKKVNTLIASGVMSCTVIIDREMGDREIHAPRYMPLDNNLSILKQFFLINFWHVHFGAFKSLSNSGITVWNVKKCNSFEYLWVKLNSASLAEVRAADDLPAWPKSRADGDRRPPA